MPNYSARDMLLRMAEGGSVASANQSVLDFINNNPDASVEAIATQINSSGADLYSLADTLNIDRSIAQEAYDEANALNQTYLDAETRVMGEINANPAAFNAADAYKEILIADAASERGVNVQGALDAGVAQSTIDRIFTTPAGSPAYTGPAPTATMSAGVQDYYNTVMADGEVDAAERLAMQKIATDQGLSYNDILAAGVDPNILYNTPAAAAAPTTKVCPIGTLKAGQTIGINDDCGVLPALPTGLTDAEGGPVTYGKGATAADLLAAEQRILGEIAASPDTWDVATAYNAILESGVTIEDALAAGVQQSTIDAIFTSGAPLPVTSFSTPSTVSSAFESAPYAGQSMEQIRTGAQNYVSGLMADGLTDAERREAQTVATQQGATFQDMLAAGVDPSILFNVPAAKEPDPVAPVPTPFPQTQPEYVPPTVYQPIAPQPDIYAPGEEALDREFRDSPPRTEVLDQYGNLAGFDYTPAAKFLSATGSGFSWTPPSVTSRPRSLMDTNTLNRYTQGRSAQDLRQLTGANYDQYSGLLNNTGSYGGGLSRSQLYALTRQHDSQRAREEQDAGQRATTRTGTIQTT